MQMRLISGSMTLVGESAGSSSSIDDGNDDEEEDEDEEEGIDANEKNTVRNWYDPCSSEMAFEQIVGAVSLME